VSALEKIRKQAAALKAPLVEWERDEGPCTMVRGAWSVERGEEPGHTARQADSVHRAP